MPVIFDSIGKHVILLSAPLGTEAPSPCPDHVEGSFDACYTPSSDGRVKDFKKTDRLCNLSVVCLFKVKQVLTFLVKSDQLCSSPISYFANYLTSSFEFDHRKA